MPTINHTIEIGGAELLAEVAVNPVAASGDGWNEPREPAHAETWLDGMWILRTRLDPATGKSVTDRTKVDCPDWLADLILAETQDEADAEAIEYLEGDDDGDDRREAYLWTEDAA
jgi:hypothetical protein